MMKIFIHFPNEYFRVTGFKGTSIKNINKLIIHENWWTLWAYSGGNPILCENFLIYLWEIACCMQEHEEEEKIDFLVLLVLRDLFLCYNIDFFPRENCLISLMCFIPSSSAMHFCSPGNFPSQRKFTINLKWKLENFLRKAIT